MKKFAAICLSISMLIFIVPVVHAEGLINRYPSIEALNLENGDLEWIFVSTDFEQMIYVGEHLIAYDYREQIVTELKSIGAIKYLGPGKTVAGDIIVRTWDNIRYSYRLESSSVLNINGKRYQVSLDQTQHINNIVNIIKDYEFAARFPKWFAWMNPANITSFTQFQTLVPDEDFKRKHFYSSSGGERSLPAELEFIAYNLWSWGYFDIEKGERYEMGSMELPKDQEYYEMTIGLSSGTSYKVMTHGSTMLLEASDMAYGCKYTLKSKKKQTSIRAAYSHWTYRWAHPPDM